MADLSILMFAIVGIIVYVLITRWIFRINEQITNQEIIIDMLGQLLLQKGFTVDEIKTLLAKYKK